ncbi:MAG: aldehyde dehydrogenase family protein [Candidatus Acidiferrales bacterium]
MAVPPEPFATATADASGVVESIDPASGVVHARFAATNPADIPAIFDRARIAQKEWAARPLQERCAMVQRLRDTIFDSREEIASVITRETGKPCVEAIFAEIVLAIDTADFLARRAPRWLRPERVPHHNFALKAKSGWLEFEPLGVVAIISPWNYPFAIPMAQIIPALLAGNAVLLKPSELTPSTGALIGDLIGKLTGELKFPPNLVQVIQGAGETGAALIEVLPDKVFFTGSVATGQRIAEACGRKLIPSVLELGGKDAMIVLGDADLDIASSAAVWGSFTNCGQACLSVERIYVDCAVAERFTALCVQKTAKLRLGPPSDADAEVGPMIRLRQLEKVEEHLREAVSRGARILFGGHRRLDLGPNFLEPAVIANVDHSMKIMREETFGPVLAIQAGQRRRELLRHLRSPSRGPRGQRLGTLALATRTHRNGSDEIRGRRPVAARRQGLVVRLHVRACLCRRSLRRFSFCARLAASRFGAHITARSAKAYLPTGPDLTGSFRGPRPKKLRQRCPFHA